MATLSFPIALMLRGFGPQVDLNTTEVTGTLGAANGGTGVANNAAATLTRSGNHALTITTSGTANLSIGTGGTLGTAAYTAATAYATTAQGATADAAMPKAGGTFTGNVLFTDNTYDIGAAGATRPRTLYTSTSVNTPAYIGDTVALTGPAAGDGFEAFKIQPATGTKAAGSKFLNTGNTTYFFIDNSAGDYGPTGGTGAGYEYVTNIRIVGNRAFQLATNDIVRWRVAGDGTATYTGTTYNMTTSGTTLTVGVGANNGTVSAGVFTDRTKHFEGDAVAALSAVKGKKGHIDHSTLPAFARANVKKDIVKDVEREVAILQEVEKDVDGTTTLVTEKVGVKTVTVQEKVGEKIEVERDLGAMISLLTVAIGQLNARIERLESK